MNFQQPPPPDLTYKYPTSTPAICKEISKHLISNAAFYNQVVHLMNRMNLPPPFRNDTPLTVDTGCQTDDIKIIRKPDLATDESEMESEEDIPSKRLNPRPVDRKRVQAYIQMEKESRKRMKVELPEEIPVKRKAINIKLAGPTIIQEDLETNDDRSHGGIERNKVIGDRVPIDKLKQDNPIFQNYSPGTPSNVLYVKNLSKTVCPEDLEELYGNYRDESSSITIDLKTTGRLRGQAFISFKGEGHQEMLAQRALEDTNGYVLKGKPIFVCFSKSKVTEK